MKLFGDISNFSNVSDYLPILNGVLFVETFVIFFTLHNFISSKTLSIWYKKFQLSAVLADVSIVFLVIILTRFLYYFFFSQFSLKRMATIIRIYFQFCLQCDNHIFNANKYPNKKFISFMKVFP